MWTAEPITSIHPKRTLRCKSPSLRQTIRHIPDVTSVWHRADRTRLLPFSAMVIPIGSLPAAVPDGPPTRHASSRHRVSGDLGGNMTIPAGERMLTSPLAVRELSYFLWGITSSSWPISGVPNIPAMPVMSGFLSLLRMECRSSTGMMSGIWIRRKPGMNNPLKRMQKGFCPYRYCR